MRCRNYSGFSTFYLLWWILCQLQIILLIVQNNILEYSIRDILVAVMRWELFNVMI